MRNIPIGQYLVENKLITIEQLDEVLSFQKKSKGKLFGDVIVELGFLTETSFAKALAGRLNVPYVQLSTYPISIEVVKKIPEAIARKYTVIAIGIDGKYLQVATNDPINFYIFEDIKVISGMEVTPLLAAKSDIIRAIGRLYSREAMDSVVENVKKEFLIEEEKASDESSLSSEKVENAPIVKLATQIIENAYRLGATDVHIEPFKTNTKIRIRVNGDMTEMMQVSNVVHASLITRYKIISNMNIAEKRLPQDGGFSQTIDGNHVDLRISSLPMVNGEKIVIRILSLGDGTLRTIKELGMNPYNYQMFSRMLKVPQGILLVTGPTGSGKTTTLYAALNEVAKPNVNVITVEDPVEKNIEGINQCQVNQKAGMTFSAALRSILRQDPDIVMVGEMRDQETAEIAIRAAITGHLVLSTLHTNDAASTIVRLIDMGVPAYMVASSLIGVVAQRLVKILCPHCKKARATTDVDNELIGIKNSITIYDSVGCKECNNTGYTGRTSIHEIILADSELISLISHGGKVEEIRELATKNGTKLLRDNIAELVVSGKTSIDELIRVTYTI